MSTPTFEEGVRISDGLLLLRTRKAGRYVWWSDSRGTRIPVGGGRYIQPDVCGRVAYGDSFHAHAKTPSVIIEVIKSHYPEAATLRELLRLTEKNYVFVLIFMGPQFFGSSYSRIETSSDDKTITLRPVIVLMGGNSLKNGVPYGDEPPLADEKQFSRWYEKYESEVLKEAMRVRF